MFTLTSHLAWLKVGPAFHDRNEEEKDLHFVK
jgi:hypothetical protein